jgi:hypothetical protein
MRHQFDRQQIGPRHHVPRTPIPKSLHEFFDAHQVNLQRLRRRQARRDKPIGHFGNFARQAAGPHQDVRTQKPAVALGEIVASILSNR